MKTHMLYRAKGRIRQYFAGTYEGTLDAEGFAVVDLKWTECKEHATVMHVALAWDLLRMCRSSWPELNMQLERIPEWKQQFING